MNQLHLFTCSRIELKQKERFSGPVNNMSLSYGVPCEHLGIMELKVTKSRNDTHKTYCKCMSCLCNVIYIFSQLAGYMNITIIYVNSISKLSF